MLRPRWDVHAMWEQARAAEVQPTKPASGDFFVLVWRRDFAVVHRPLDSAQGRALESLARGETFAEISAHAEPDATGRADPRQVVEWLSAWLAAGLIAAVVEDESV